MNIYDIGEPFSPEGRMERFKSLLESCPGNYCEIGAGLGLTTKILAEAARKHETKVLVIDPFESGWGLMPDSYGRPYPYSKFIENIEGYEDVIILCKHRSDSKEAKEQVLLMDITFAFIDGLQFKENVLNDLELMCGAKIICVDDINRETQISQVPEAVREFLKLHPEYELQKSNLIEGYLCLTK